MKTSWIAFIAIACVLFGSGSAHAQKTAGFRAGGFKQGGNAGMKGRFASGMGNKGGCNGGLMNKNGMRNKGNFGQGGKTWQSGKGGAK